MALYGGGKLSESALLSPDVIKTEINRMEGWNDGKSAIILFGVNRRLIAPLLKKQSLRVQLSAGSPL